MTEFAHSEVLFAGDDGLPIEFNIQSTVEKGSLKAIIEYGGGMCTLSDKAIYLVSPGTTVLPPLDPGKTLISSRYVFDCVKENCLLETDDYKIEINEMQASDFSDNSADLCGSIGIIDPDKTSPNLLNCPGSNHDFDFEDSASRNYNVAPDKEEEPEGRQLTSEKHSKFSTFEKEKKISGSSVSSVPDSLEENAQPMIVGENELEAKVSSGEVDGVTFNDKDKDSESNKRHSPIIVVVSSSQPNADDFDNMVLNKAQEAPQENDDGLSQSYTVSSSADAQISPKPPSHHTSAEIFDGSGAAPDSGSQIAERQQYIKHMEKEVEKILQKPSPKSIQDKITMVKYICIVKKLSPAIVLQTLQNF